MQPGLGVCFSLPTSLYLFREGRLSGFLLLVLPDCARATGTTSFYPQITQMAQII
jgi:hypothetical protein